MAMTTATTEPVPRMSANQNTELACGFAAALQTSLSPSLRAQRCGADAPARMVAIFSWTGQTRGERGVAFVPGLGAGS